MWNRRQSFLFSSHVFFLIKARTNRPSKFLLCSLWAEKLEWMMCWWWIGLLPCKLYCTVPLVTIQDVAAFFFYLMIYCTLCYFSSQSSGNMDRKAYIWCLLKLKLKTWFHITISKRTVPHISNNNNSLEGTLFWYQVWKTSIKDPCLSGIILRCKQWRIFRAVNLGEKLVI